MKKILTFLLLLFPVLVFGQANISWIQNMNGVSIAIDNSNNVFTINNQTTGGGDIYLTKRNSAGTMLWQSHFDQTDSTKFEKAVWVETDNQGNAVVIGNLMGLGVITGVNGGIVMKFDPAGNLLWRNMFENTSAGTVTKKCIIDQQNNIYVLYGNSGNSTGSAVKVRKYSPDGTLLWNYTGTSSTGTMSPVNFKFTRDHYIVVTGRSMTSNSNNYFRLDLNGNLIWNIAGIPSTNAGDVAGDETGNSYLLFGSSSSVTGQTSVRKVSQSGTQIWQNNYNLNAAFIETGADNNSLLAGKAGNNTMSTAFAKVSADGILMWINPNASGNVAFSTHAMMKLDLQNNGYMAGSTLTSMAVCKINSNGSSSWSLAIPGFGTVSNFMGGIDLGSDNAVYLTGSFTAKISQSNLPTTCPVPQNLHTTDITANSARVNWDFVSGALRYEVFYTPALNITVTRRWTRVSVPGNENSVILSPLRCNSLHYWRIRSVCDTLVPIAVPNMSDIQSFRTAECDKVPEVIE